MDGENNGKSLLKVWMIRGYPLFSETSIQLQGNTKLLNTSTSFRKTKSLGSFCAHEASSKTWRSGEFGDVGMGWFCFEHVERPL